jgi:hypothetical protein
MSSDAASHVDEAPVLERFLDAQASQPQQTLHPHPFDVELISRREDTEQLLDFESRARLGQDVVVGASCTFQLCERHTRWRVMEPGGETARVSGDDFERPTHRLWPCPPAPQVTVRTPQGPGDVRASGQQEHQITVTSDQAHWR